MRVAGNEVIVDFEAKKTDFELCYEITQSERIDSQRYLVWSRRRDAYL